MIVMLIWFGVIIAVGVFSTLNVITFSAGLCLFLAFGLWLSAIVPASSSDAIRTVRNNTYGDDDDFINRFMLKHVRLS